MDGSYRFPLSMSAGSLLCLLLIVGAHAVAEPLGSGSFIPSTNPVFQVDYPSPTADKPQSKLWYMNNRWWTLLPRESGPSLWERTDSGWVEHSEVARALTGTPRRADVWPGDNFVTAVAVGDTTKTNPVAAVFRLTRGLDADSPWKPQVLATLLPPTPDDAIETATILQDAVGAWWVAAVAGVKVCVWTASADATVWSGPTVLAEGVAPDDICVITPMPGKLTGVIWSDQVREGFLMRSHADGAGAKDWREETVIQLGGMVGDDHLNTVLAPGGTLWLATKNSVDTVGKPQFTLYERQANGAWQAWPFGVLGETTRPSRPIVVCSASGGTVLTGYGDNDRALPPPYDARIVFSRVNRVHPARVEAPRTVIAPALALNSRVQNVTGPRHPFPAVGPWIILASDPEGRVFEADLRAAFGE